MAKTISTQDLVNELENAIKQSKELLRVQNKLAESIKESAKELKEGFGNVSKDNTKELAKFNKLLEQTNKLAQAEEKNNQEKLKTEQQLIKNQKEASVLRAQLIKEQQTEIRLQKQLKKEREDSFKQAEKEAKLREDANDEYKKQSKRLNELRKSYKNLAAQNKENTAEAKEMLKEITKLDKRLKDIDETVGQNQRSVGNYTKAMEKMNSTLSKLGVLAIVTKGFQMLTNAIGGSRDGAETFEKLFAGVTVSLSVFAKRIGKALKGITEALAELDFEKAIKSGTEAFEGMAEEIETATAQTIKAVDTTRKYFIEIQRLERIIADLTNTQRLNLQVAEDDTLSFLKRAEASDKARKAAKDLKKEIEAQTEAELKSANKRLAISLGISTANKTAIQQAEEIKLALADQTKQGSISDEMENEFTQAYVNYKAKRLEADEMYLDTLEKQNKLYSDLNEVELDLELDLLDNKKSINERIIADDKVAFETRKKLLEDQKTEFDEIFIEQLETVIKQRKRVIETERERLKLAKESGEISDKEFQKEQSRLRTQELALNTYNLENIAKMENVELQKQEIMNLQLGEKFTLRYLEVIKDYRTGVLDLKEAQKELNEEMSGKKLEQRKEMFDAFNTYVDDQFQKSNEKRIAEIDKEADAIESRIETIRTAAENGTEAARQSLAKAEREEAELAKKREQQRKREVKQEAIIAGIQLLGANADQPNALSKTISDYTALVGVISSLPAFIEGTEKVSEGVKGGVKFSNGTDGYLARFDGDERILNPKQNEMLGNLTNDEVAKLGQMHRMGELTGGVVAVNNNKGIEEKIDRMTKSIENLHKQIPIQRVDYDAKTKEYVHSIESNNKTEKLRTKAAKLWR